MKTKSNPAISSVIFLQKTFHEYRSTLLFIFFYFCIRSSFADWSPVPTGSMLPTIVEGDVITINKAAYDIRIPFTHYSLLRTNEPIRGDIVVFDSKVSQKRLVKRLVGLPGDIVAMHNNHLSINGKILKYELVKDNLVEHLDAKSHNILLMEKLETLHQSFEAVRVPTNHYLVLGDNRDNSADSRIIGFVPREELVGRAGGVAISFDMNDFYLPRKDRLWIDLR